MRRAAVVLAGFALVLQGCASGTPQLQPEASSTPTPSATPSPKPTKPSPSRPSSTLSLEELATQAENASKQQNPLYQAGVVPAVRCGFPTGALRTRTAVLGYAKAVVTCLDKAWEPVMVRARAYYQPPLLYAVEPGTKTACGEFGSDEYTAYFCGVNKAIYFDWQEYADGSGEDGDESQVRLQYLMGHEHGHHLQHLAGISTFYGFRGAGSAAELEESRRHEIQASCLGFAFLGANRSTLGLTGERLAILRDLDRNGDDPDGTRDHGSSKNNRVWSRAAFASKSPASCNTWAAPAKRVS